MNCFYYSIFVSLGFGRRIAIHSAMPKKCGKWLLSILLGIGLIILGTKAYAAEVKLAWDANQESDLEGYGVYLKIGTDGPPYDFLGYVSDADLPDANSPTFLITGLQQDAIYYFAITAYDTSGNESAFSTSVCAEVGAVVTPCASGSSDTIPPTPDNSSSRSIATASGAPGNGGGGGCFISTIAP